MMRSLLPMRQRRVAVCTTSTNRLSATGAPAAWLRFHLGGEPPQAAEERDQ
jgi:hypothetical protein